MSTLLHPRLIIPTPSIIYTDRSLRNLLWHLHGSLLCIAFLVFFPLGVVAIRSGSRHALRYHWLLQTSGTILALTGIAVGILMSKGLSLFHQYLGLVLGVVLLIQPATGWKHHVDFSRMKRRTWVSFTHMWSGRIGVGAGWVNILLGLVLRNYNFLVQAGAGVAMLCLTVLWGMWGLGVFSKQPGIRVEGADDMEYREGLMTGIGNEFALDDLDEEEDEENGADHQQLKPFH